VTLAVTLLTGLRPGLLARTLRAVLDHHPELFRYDWVTLHNGGDPETGEVLRSWRGFIGPPVPTDTFLGVGQATSLLFALADADTILHLEDDWEAAPAPPGWLPEARSLLDDVFQVRLRLASERVKTRHMVTGRPLRWSGTNGTCRVSGDAHFTLNPSLIRSADLRLGFPAASERDAQGKLHDAGRRRVAQLVPGVFRHSGGEDSLRLRPR